MPSPEERLALAANATLDLRIGHLRAAAPEHALVGEAQCYPLTPHVAFVRATAWEMTPADPLASCLATFTLGANPSLGPGARAQRTDEEIA